MCENVSATDKLQKNCEGCIYFGGGNESARTCNYIFITGKRRPCNPGKECTEKIWRKGGKK